MTHQQAADAVGRSRPAASNLLRLLQLVTPVQELLMSHEIDMGTLVCCCRYPARCRSSWLSALSRKLSVRDTERMVQNALKPPKSATVKLVDRDVLRLQEELSDALGAQVEIRASKRGSGKSRSSSRISTASMDKDEVKWGTGSGASESCAAVFVLFCHIQGCGKP